MQTPNPQPFIANTQGYWQLVFRIEGDQAEAFEQIWSELGALSVSLEDYALYAKEHGLSLATEEPIFAEPSSIASFPEEDQTPLWDDCVAKVLLPHSSDTTHLVLQSLALEAKGTLLEQEWIGSQDWLAKVQNDFQPIVLSKLAVIAHWHTPPTDKLVIRMDPGQAFGSGAHTTTQLMLMWLEKQALSNQLNHKRLVDYGCGSGILAIAAAKLCKTLTAFATDIDPIALDVTRENCSRNDIAAAQCNVMNADDLVATLTLPNSANIVLANILLQPLISLEPTFKRLILAGGKLLLTGILSEQVEQLTSIYHEENGWVDFQILAEEDGWALAQVNRIL